MATRKREQGPTEVTDTSRVAYHGAVVEKGLHEGIRLAILAAFERSQRPLSCRELERAIRANHQQTSATIKELKDGREVRVHHEGWDRVTERRVEYFSPIDWEYSAQLEAQCTAAEPPPYVRPADGRPVQEIIMEYVRDAWSEGHAVTRRQIEKDTGLSHQAVAAVKTLKKRGLLVVHAVQPDPWSRYGVELLRPSEKGEAPVPVQATLL
jgi:hypothetical protein